MEYSVSAEDKGLCVALSGELTFDCYKEFKSVMDEIQSETQAVTLCLSGISCMDSAGAGLLKLAHAKAEEKQVPFDIVNVPTEIKTLVSLVVP